MKINALKHFLTRSGCDATSNAARVLGYIVKETVEGRGADIKSVTIAQDIFKRGAGFDPSRDSIVRVEMKRLRDSLDHYYRTAGADDPVRIVIPKGSYTPRFHAVTVEKTGLAHALQPFWRLGAALALVVLLGGTVLRFFVGTANGVATIDHPPRLAVLAGRGTEQVQAVTRETLSRFRNINIVIGQDQDTDFEVQLTRLSDEVQLALVDRLDQRELSFASVNVDENGLFASPAERVMLVSWLATVAQRNGQIESRIFKTRRLEGDMRCTFMVEAYFGDQSDEKHYEAVACLRNFMRFNQPTVRTHIDLAYMFREEFTDQRNPQPGDPLKRAADNARAAVGRDPFAAEAHYALMTVLFTSGATVEAMRAGDKAIALNPHDAEILAGYAARLNIIGHHARALSMFRRAELLAPADPGWRIYGVFLAQLGLNDLDAAAETSKAFLGTRNPLYLAARAIGCRHTSDDACYDKAMSDLKTAEPDIRSMFERRNYDPALTDKIVTALADD